MTDPRTIEVGTLYALRRDVSTLVKVIKYSGGIVTAAHNAMWAEEFLPSDLSAEMHPDCPHCGIPLYAADDPNGIMWDHNAAVWAHDACVQADPES